MHTHTYICITIEWGDKENFVEVHSHGNVQKFMTTSQKYANIIKSRTVDQHFKVFKFIRCHCICVK